MPCQLPPAVHTRRLVARRTPVNSPANRRRTDAEENLDTLAPLQSVVVTPPMGPGDRQPAGLPPFSNRLNAHQRYNCGTFFSVEPTYGA